MEKILIGISACLLGKKVRYDGQHKLDSFIVGTLSNWFEFVPVCPEIEFGLGVPRDTIRLEGTPEDPRLVKSKTKEDITEGMRRYSKQRVAKLEKENLGGYILKARSPSCGMERVKVYSDKGMPSNKGVGIYAAELMKQFPLIPIEEEGRLHDAALREKFIEQVFTLQRWRQMLAENSTRGGLVKFHERHKYLLMAHSVPHYRAMGRLVADMKGQRLANVQKEYLEQLMEALRLRATVAKHVNVLQHLGGYFKKQLDADEKAELKETIGSYKLGHFPLIVPITLINHYIRKYQEPYLSHQVYLKPGPTELRLRNQVY